MILQSITHAPVPDALAALRLFMEQYDRPGDASRARRPEIIAGRAAIAAAKLKANRHDLSTLSPDERAALSTP